METPTTAIYETTEIFGKYGRYRVMERTYRRGAWRLHRSWETNDPNALLAQLGSPACN